MEYIQLTVSWLTLTSQNGWYLFHPPNLYSYFPCLSDYKWKTYLYRFSKMITAYWLFLIIIITIDFQSGYIIIFLKFINGNIAKVKLHSKVLVMNVKCRLFMCRFAPWNSSMRCFCVYSKSVTSLAIYLSYSIKRLQVDYLRLGPLCFPSFYLSNTHIGLKVF